MNLEKAVANLKRRGFAVSQFATGKEAVDYLAQEIQDTTVGMGGSVTLQQLGLYERLQEKNQVFWHLVNLSEETMQKANASKVYITSANGVAETGEIINIDGRGNRVAGTLYGPERAYIVVGQNKFAETFEQALWRARNIAGPKNAQRLQKNTPCAKRGDRCYDCNSPERICRGLVVLLAPVFGIQRTEIVIVQEDLGY